MITNSRPIVSLFDMTGNMVKPWAEIGYKCHIFDLQNEGLYHADKNGGVIVKHSADLYDNKWLDVIKTLNPAIIFAFPPCTDLAVSGAAHFASKKLANPNYRQEAMNLVYLGRDIAEAIGCPYMIENPVSVISTEWRKPNFKFHPHEYGGYLPKDDVHPEYPEYILPRDAYPKKTCLWTGNGFEMPSIKSVMDATEAGAYSLQYKKLGGKSLKTKNIRSATPRGFAKAVCEHYTKENIKEA